MYIAKKHNMSIQFMMKSFEYLYIVYVLSNILNICAYASLFIPFAVFIFELNFKLAQLHLTIIHVLKMQKKNRIQSTRYYVQM